MQTSGPGLRSDRTPTLEQFIWENLHAVLFPTAVSSCIPTVTSHSSDLGVYLVEIYRDDGPALDPRVHCMFSFLPMKCADSGLNIYTNIAGSLGTEVPTNERYSHPEAAHRTQGTARFAGHQARLLHPPRGSVVVDHFCTLAKARDSISYQSCILQQINNSQKTNSCQPKLCELAEPSLNMDVSD